ncbi:MAG: HesB/IscA family protein [Planctomycetota bacterium]|jgi:iron-sulfur cluster assembly protein
MIEMTAAAGREIARLIEAEGGSEGGGLRLFVKGGGCSGMLYDMKIVEGAEEKDKVFEIEGVRVIVDPKSYLFLNGTRVDFKESLMGRGFVFENPNAKNSCGCGTSFSI